MKRSLTVALCAVMFSVSAGVASAQRGDPSFEGPRGVFTFELSDGEPISFFLEWSRVLDLTDAQRDKLMELRRRLRAETAPFVERLDSLRELAGIDMTERGRLSSRDREALARFERWSKPIADSIRVYNDAARLEARQLLAEPQRARADSLAAARGRGEGGRGRPRVGEGARLRDDLAGG